MADLIVREISEALVSELEKQAAAHGITAEEELRRIVRKEFPAEKELEVEMPSFKDHLLEMPNVGEEWMFDRNDVRMKRLAGALP